MAEALTTNSRTEHQDSSSGKTTSESNPFENDERELSHE